MPKIIEDEKVFQAVLETVIERGYIGATTRQLAEAADISEVTLFRKYGSKQALVKRAFDGIIEQSDFDAALRYSGDVAADLLRVVQTYQDSAVRHSRFIAIMLSEMPHAPELAGFIKAPFSIYQGIAKLIARYQADGILHQEEPLHAVAALLGPMIYIAMIRMAMGESAMPPLDLDVHLHSFLEGRRAPK